MLKQKRFRHKFKATKLLSSFGRYLKYHRKQERLTLRAFASRMQMPYINIYQFEQGRKDPRLTELEQLAKGFNQSLIQFIREMKINEM